MSSSNHPARRSSPSRIASIATTTAGCPRSKSFCARYGDPEGRKIYMQPRDLEQKWMDMHERETGIKIPLD